MLAMKNNSDARPTSPSPMNTIDAQAVAPMAMNSASKRFLEPL